jgi:hypothetical protein
MVQAALEVCPLVSPSLTGDSSDANEKVEFCPALDSSLVAAILSESDLSKSSIDSVRQVLSQLSLRAERTSEDATAVLNDYSSTSTPTSASLSTFNVDPDSMSSASSQSVTAPLAFLQAGTSHTLHTTLYVTYNYIRSISRCCHTCFTGCSRCQTGT